MAGILDKIKMSEIVASPSGPETKRDLPSLEDARHSVIKFLKDTLPEVKQVNVSKLAPIDIEKGTWESEADVYLPNAAIKALGLPTQKDVLDCRAYLLRLDSRLKVTAFGLRDSVGE